MNSIDRELQRSEENLESLIFGFSNLYGDNLIDKIGS